MYGYGVLEGMPLAIRWGPCRPCKLSCETIGSQRAHVGMRLDNARTTITIQVHVGLHVKLEIVHLAYAASASVVSTVRNGCSK